MDGAERSIRNFETLKQNLNKNNSQFAEIFGSSAKSVGELRFWQFSKLMK
jgi:hypothetical protein